MSDRVHDQAVMIGARKTLIGVVTQAVKHEPGDRPVFVILNSGIVHRVGHHRMYVTLARMLAAAGYRALRFDLSGVGDSESRANGPSLLEDVLADIKEAIDWLVATQSARRVILVGLCSGADHALLYGLSDQRVSGLVLLDPSIPPTRGFYLRYFARHLRRPRSWFDLVAGRGRLWMTLRKFLGIAPPEAWEHHRPNLGDPRVHDFLQTAYQRTMDSGTQCLAVFTSGFPHQHNYRRQILDAFPTVRFGDGLQLEYFARCDHVFTSEVDRGRLFRIVMEWAERVSSTAPVTVPEEAKQPIRHAGQTYVSYEA